MISSGFRLESVNLWLIHPWVRVGLKVNDEQTNRKFAPSDKRPVAQVYCYDLREKRKVSESRLIRNEA